MNAFGDATMALALFLLIWETGTLDFARRLRRCADELGGTTVDARRARPARRRGREVGADPAAHLAAGRDGGPDAGQRADPRGDDGDGRRLPDRPPAPDLRGTRPRSQDLAAGLGAVTLLVAGPDRARADRHQARDRLLDDVADRLHVRRRRDRRVRERDVPPDDARLLQGAALPRAPASSSTRSPASRTCGRWAACARYLPKTWVAMLIGALALAGIPPLLRLLLEGRDPRRRRSRAATGTGYLLFAVGLAGAFLTGLYTFRMFFLVFGGEPSRVRARAPARARRHGEGPFSMICDGRRAGRARDRRRLDPDPGRSGTCSTTSSSPVAPSPLVEPTGAAGLRRRASLAVALGLAGIGVAWVIYGARTRPVPRQAARPARARAQVLLRRGATTRSSTGRPSRSRRRCTRFVERPLIAGSIAGARGRHAARRRAASAAPRPASSARYALALAGGVAVLVLVFLVGRDDDCARPS